MKTAIISTLALISFSIVPSMAVPAGCPSDAIAGDCKNCNGNGCSAFKCSAFTTWSCPSGYTECGSEVCQSGFCAAKKYCAPDARILSDVSAKEKPANVANNGPALEDEQMNLRGKPDFHRKLAPSGCPSDAIAGNCKNCNGNGCSAFKCSAFTTWSCPSGYTECGSEVCQSGFCAAKKWCAPDGRALAETSSDDNDRQLTGGGLMQLVAYGEEKNTTTSDDNDRQLTGGGLMQLVAYGEEKNTTTSDDNDRQLTGSEEDPSDNLDEGSQDLFLLDEDQHSRKLAPSGCSADAIAGKCKNCNGNGCSAFECSDFTTWSCPSGYTECGKEICQSGLCASKKWCDPDN